MSGAGLPNSWSPSCLPPSDQRRVDDDVVPVAAGGLVVAAPAGDQPQLGFGRVAVDGLRGEAVLGDLLGPAHPEPGRGAVLPGHLDLVARAEFLEPEEDPRLPVAVDVAEQDGGTRLARGAGV